MQKAIKQNVTKHCSYGTSLKTKKENSGRRRTAPSEENIKLVRNILENKPNLTRIFIKNYGRHVEWRFTEVVPHRCSSKQLFWKYAANLQENTHAEVWFHKSWSAALLKSLFRMGVLLYICWMFAEHIFWRTPIEDWF